MTSRTLPRFVTLGFPMLNGLPLRRWLSISRHRAALARLDPHLLADIGITADMAHTEASRPFWDVPAHWKV